MTVREMKEIAKQNNGVIPAGLVMTMTDFEISMAIKHGYLKDVSEKVQSPELKKEIKKDILKSSEMKVSEEKQQGKKSKENDGDKNVNVINPPVSQFSKEEENIYRNLDGLIYDRMADMQRSSFDIAYAVYSIYSKAYYKIDGYKNIYDYARERYGISRGTTNNFINIVDRFCDLKKPVFELKPEFADFNSTQLICMLGHTDDELKEKKIVPEMSSRDIRKALKDKDGENKGNSEVVNILNGGKSDAEEAGVEGLKELQFNVVLELNESCLQNLPESSDKFESYISDILMGKAKVICKLLKSGHCIQILDIL